MKNSIAIAVIASILSCGAAPRAAHADVTISSHMAFTGAFVDQLQKQGKGNPFAQFSEMRMYMAPKHFRMDMGLIGMIVDLDTKKMVTLNNTAHTYTEKDFDPAQTKDLMSNLMGNKTVYTSVVDTGKTTKYMGHDVRHFTAEMTVTLPQPNLPPNMRTMNVTMDILAAQDLPQTDQDMLATYGSMMGTPSKLKGLALMTRATYTSGILNGTVMNMNATAVSTKPIDTIVFDIPTGFTKTEPNPAAAAVAGA